MANWNDTDQRQGFGSVPRAGDAVARQETFDAGLRAHMLKIYNYMASGVLLTGLVAMLTARSGLALTFASGPLMWIVALAPLGFVFAMSFGVNKFSQATLQLMFWAFATVMGLSLSTIFLVYTGQSILRIFFITAGMFAAMSLYGYTTKRDLTGFGSFLFMGVIGLVIASVVNLFLHSTGLQFAISAITVLVFTGLTAFDTQRIKSEFYEGDPAEIQTKQAVFGATSLYVNFLNIFMALLQLFGQRNN